MIHNALFQECLKLIPNDQKAQFEESFAIAEYIFQTLNEKGVTPKDLANKLHIRESEISKWLTGRYIFNLDEISKIEKALKCKIITHSH